MTQRDFQNTVETVLGVPLVSALTGTGQDTQQLRVQGECPLPFRLTTSQPKPLGPVVLSLVRWLSRLLRLPQYPNIPSSKKPSIFVILVFREYVPLIEVPNTEVWTYPMSIVNRSLYTNKSLFTIRSPFEKPKYQHSTVSCKNSLKKGTEGSSFPFFGQVERIYRTTTPDPITCTEPLSSSNDEL